MVRAVAEALGVPIGLRTGEAAAAAVASGIADLGKALIVLDDLDPVAEVAGQAIWGWLSSSQVRVLITCRTRLDVGEHVVEVAGLARADAVALLRERAGVSREVLSDEEAAALVDRMDGLPLAIVLAAGRLRVMGARSLAARLDDRRVLSGGRGSERHASIDVALAAAEEGLSAADRRALAAVSTFEGPFDWDGAEAVVGEDAIARVQTLVDRSWVRADPATGRLWMLGLMRTYARDRADDADRADAEIRHGAWYARDAPSGLPSLRASLPDLVAACRRAIARGDVEVASDAALRAFLVLQRCGPLSLAVDLLSAAEGFGAPYQRDSLRVQLGHALRMSGRVTEAQIAYEGALAEAKRLQDRRGEAIVNQNLAIHPAHPRSP